MFKKNEVHDDYTIVVEPTALGNLGFMRTSDNLVSSNVHQDYVERCQEIVDQINRHVNNVDRVKIEFTTVTQFLCEFCGEEEGLSLGNIGEPYCCDKAQKEWLTLNPEYNSDIFSF